jgi:hypothetical protein
VSEIVETDGDTIYVIDKQPLQLRANAPELFDTIDWLALAKQKNELLQIIDGEKGSQPEHILEGLVNLIDAIQDVGEARDYPVVYGYNREEWEQDQAEAQDNGA